MNVPWKCSICGARKPWHGKCPIGVWSSMIAASLHRDWILAKKDRWGALPDSLAHELAHIEHQFPHLQHNRSNR